jgi:hypothetical protein
VCSHIIQKNITATPNPQNLPSLLFKKMVLSQEHYTALKAANTRFLTAGDAFGAVEIEHLMQTVFGDYTTRTSTEAQEWKQHWTLLESWFEEKAGPPPSVRSLGISQTCVLMLVGISIAATPCA